MAGVLCALVFDNMYFVDVHHHPYPTTLHTVVNNVVKLNDGGADGLIQEKTRGLRAGMPDPLGIAKPRLDIMCRTFHGAFFEIMRMVVTYLIFFPKDEMATQIVLVLDAENELDHLTGSILETAYKDIGVRVLYEEPPPVGTLTSIQRSEGFSRTQWSNFYSDLYSDADFIGIIDSDAEFSFRPVLSKHVVVDGKKPVIHGIVAPGGPVECVTYMIGRDRVAEFMYVFPFVVKREHFALIRQHIVRTTGKETFEQAWIELQVRFNTLQNFLLMGNYLFYYHHDEYEWDIVNSQLSTVASPSPHIGKNLPMDEDVERTVRKYHDQMCVNSKDVASECGGMTPAAIEAAKFVPFTDFWPMVNGEVGYNYPASKSHDGTGGRDHQVIFDKMMDDAFPNRQGDEFWRRTRYNRTERTRNPSRLP